MNHLIVKITKLTAIVVVTILVVTNPGNDKYQLYASEKLVNYLQEDGCSQITGTLSQQLQNPCRILVTTARPQIESAIAKNTEYKNFFLFSLYSTNLSLASLTPSYDFATLGVFNRFITYQAETND